MDIFSVIRLICGLTFFLFGMKVMSGDLEKLAGGRLETVLKRVTSRPLLSILMGLVITVAMQSSSAVAVMLVGLVNSGIMAFSQTVYVLFGANIGTTLTSWLLALSGIQGDAVWIRMLKPENFSPILAFFGILFVLFSKKEKRKSVGTVLVGFSVLMIGMVFMTQAVSPLAEDERFTALTVRFNNPLFGLLLGTVVTAVLQSSAASIGILQALSLSGAIPISTAAPIVMGQNIGTCITGVLSGIGSSNEAKRVPLVHTLIKTLGAAICLSVFVAVRLLFRPPLLETAATPWGIAVIHSAYNVITTLALLPFSKALARLTERMLPDKKKTGEAEPVYAPDERLLYAPAVAVRESEEITKRMGALAQSMLTLILTNLTKADDKTENELQTNEKRLDAYEDALDTYLVRLSPFAVSESDSRKITRMLHAIGDFERLGDHAINLLHAAKEIRKKDLVFSSEAEADLAVLTGALTEILNETIDCYRSNDRERAKLVEPLEQVIDGLVDKARVRHIRRLRESGCTVEAGVVYGEILTNLERVSDHCSNVAAAIIEGGQKEYDTHRYLNAVKHSDPAFRETYRRYEERYQLM